MVTATWNCRHTIADCIASVQAQREVAVDHVVIDGASTDGTREWLAARAGEFGTFSSEPDDGIYDALNRGIAGARGEVVGFLHADDLFAHDRVLARVAEAFEDPAVQGVYGDLCYVEQQDTSRVVRYWQAGAFSRAKLARGWMPPHPTLYLRRSCYERLGGFDIGYRIAADYHSILRLFSEPGFRVVYLPEVLVNMRVGGASNRSLRNIVRKSREDYRALRETGVGGAGTLALKNLGKVGQFFRRAG
ncbi:Glycosyl transferase, family 2 [Pseudohaliea rubra DSM 19751]|uniref:Glycosyl transferase, family 2 n=1 Tax=Pseudohaliea rubra DSM 19751 TaxID=1265313 RepID=A0A095WYU3_9GAMM|nr:Glycosyl transferase, family 2 [Pseudohaliea rubra DSM 19751]